MVEKDSGLALFQERLSKLDFFDDPTQEMIDFYKEKGFLHIRAQRTASTSIHRMLGGDSRHIGAFVWRKFLNFKRTFVFSICRNPYDRFVSSYYRFAKDPREVNQYLKEEGTAWVTRVRFFSLLPQHIYFHDPKTDKLLLDYLGRFEELEKSWKHIKKKLGLKGKLPHIGPSRKGKLNKYSRSLIYPFYKKDFELLGYDKK